MSTEHVAPFHGDREDENPEDFLRSFFRRMGNNTDDVKKRQFPNYLQADSVADEWFEDLPPNDKANWAAIEAAFRVRWPRKKAAKKTKEEYEEDIMMLKLKMEDIGKKEKIAGREIYSHIAWTDKMEVLVKGAKLDNTTTLISGVRKELPKLVKDKIGSGHANWTAFLKAICDIDIDYIREGADTWKKEQADQDAIKTQLRQLGDLLRASPTAQLQQQLASLSLGNQPSTPIPPPRQATMGGGRGSSIMPTRITPNAFAKRPPPTPADRATLRQQLQKYPQHPDTEAGRQAHAAQQADWFKTHGVGARVTESTPFPLRPGSAPVNSGECFTCGFSGHIGGKDGAGCRGHRPLHTNKQVWRLICFRILKEPRPTANIQLVAVDDYGNVWQAEQGNGEGSSA